MIFFFIRSKFAKQLRAFVFAGIPATVPITPTGSWTLRSGRELPTLSTESGPMAPAVDSPARPSSTPADTGATPANPSNSGSSDGVAIVSLTTQVQQLAASNA